MHDSSLAKMRAFVDLYLGEARGRPLGILDVGAQAVDGHASYRPLFTHAGWRYTGLDMAPGPNVDVVVADPYQWREVPEASAGVVVSGQALEHIEFPWLTMAQIERTLEPGGIACLIVPSSGPEHRYPLDCWRIYPDGIVALARFAGLRPVEVFTDWGILPWQDTFAVLQKPANGRSGAFEPQTDRQAAWSVYRQAMRGRVGAPAYYAHAAQLYRDGGDVESACALLRQGVIANPAALELRQQFITALLAAGRTHAAMEQALALLAMKPLTPASVDAAAAAYDALNVAQRAFYRTALDLEPATLTRIARLASGRERWPLAEACWRRLTQLAPDDAANAGEHALALLGSGSPEARAAFRSACSGQRERGEVNRTTVVQRLIEARGFRSYVEIGVERGGHFMQIEAPLKLGVDPRFRIPGGARDALGERFFEQTSDAFFAAPPAEVCERGIDIALVDGLHTHQQALRDIEHCLRHLNPGGVIVVHDCLPASPAEAAPTLAEARATPGYDGNWTGDVYRAIVRLRARRPDLRVWVLDTDHGVGLVERVPATQPLVSMDDAEIDALDYATLSAARTALLGLAPPAAFDAWLAGVPATDEDAYESALPPALLDEVQRGVMATRYKGLRLLKSPFDLSLYLQLLDRLRPGSVIEIGSFEGGSSVWFADQMVALGLAPCVLAIDRDREPLHRDPRVRFLRGDAEALGRALDDRLLAELPRPWLVVEDSAHTRSASLAVLEFFDAHLRTGDYIVVEDGVVRHLPGEVYRRYEDGPCRALAEFLEGREARYEVDRSLCDFYGRNVTYNPGGWLRRTG